MSETWYSPAMQRRRKKLVDVTPRPAQRSLRDLMPTGFQLHSVQAIGAALATPAAQPARTSDPNKTPMPQQLPTKPHS